MDKRDQEGRWTRAHTRGPEGREDDVMAPNKLHVILVYNVFVNKNIICGRFFHTGAPYDVILSQMTSIYAQMT